MAKVNFSTLTKNILAKTFRDNVVDQDKKAGYMEIYSNPMATSIDKPVDKTYLIGRLDLQYPSADDPENGVLQFKFTKVNIAVASGKAIWARVYTNSGKPILDMDISEQGDTNIGTLVLNKTDIKKDGAILVNKMVFIIG